MENLARKALSLFNVHLTGRHIVALTIFERELFEKLAESLGTSVKPQEKGFLDWLNDAFGG